MNKSNVLETSALFCRELESTSPLLPPHTQQMCGVMPPGIDPYVRAPVGRAVPCPKFTEFHFLGVSNVLMTDNIYKSGL